MKTTLLKRVVGALVLALGLTGASTASAAATAKAVEYNDGRVVYYYNDTTYTVEQDGVLKVWTTLTSSKQADMKVPAGTPTTIVFDPSFAGYQPTSLTGYFWGFSTVTAIQGLEYLDTSAATSMNNMFRGCSALTAVDLSRFNTEKASMNYMFSGCGALTTLDITSFSNKSLDSVNYMFNACKALTTIYANRDFDCSAKAGDQAFYACSTSLKGDRGSTWSSKKYSATYARLDGGTEAPGYFSRAYRTLTVDASGFAAQHVASVSVATNGVALVPTSGTTYSLEHGVPATVTYTAANGYWFAGEPTYVDNRYATTGLTADATLSGDDIPSATLIPQDSTLTIDLAECAASNIQSVVVKLAASGEVVEPTAPGVYTVKQGVGFTVAYQAVSAKYFFVSSNKDKGDIIDSYWTDETYAASGISGDATIVPSKAADQVLSGSVIRAVVTPDDPWTLTYYREGTPVGTVYQRKASSGIPTWCGLTTVTNVVVDTSMADFRGDGNGFQYLFYDLPNVKQIVGLANLNTSAATTFYQMFQNCSSLESLDLSSFHAPNLTQMGYMFLGCSSLTELDISAIDSIGVTACDGAFRGCSKLATIYVRSGFGMTKAVGTWMFWSDTKLVGGQGTTYTTALGQQGSAPAHIDGGASNPGFFTLKTQTLTIDTSDFAAKHIDSVVVATNGVAVVPVGGVYTVGKGEGVTIAYTAESGYLFASGESYVDTTYAETGLVANVTIAGEAVPMGVQARSFTVPTADFDTHHIGGVAVTLAVGGTAVEPASTDPNVYRVAEGAAFDVTFTAANGYCFEGIGRHQEFSYADGIEQDTTFDMTQVAPTVEVADSYTVRYYDGKNTHFALRDARYPYSETDSFALWDASSMAPTGDKANARFIGWCQTPERSDAPVTSLPPLSLGDLKLYAKYEYTATSWLTEQAKDMTVKTNWTGNVIAHASSDKVTAGQSYEVTMQYRIHLPESFEPGRKYPVIFTLHGAGARGSDGDSEVGEGFKDILDYVRRQNLDVIAIAPQVPTAGAAFGPSGSTAWDFVSETMRAEVPGSSPKQYFGPTWVDAQWSSRTNHTMAATPTVWFQAAKAILDEVLANADYQVDPERVYVTGTSMGGYGTWEMLERYPTLFAAAIPCCGGADTNQLASAANVPIWAFHGSKDNTVPTVRSRDAVAALIDKGGVPRYREYGGDYASGAGLCSNHNCWDVTFTDDNVMDWLFEQRRDHATTTVTWNGGASGDWATASNWSPRAPQAGDDVVIDTAASVTLSAVTPRYRSVTIGATAAATLNLSGWDTALWADTVTVGPLGTVTCAKGGETKASLSRVWIKGYEVNVAEGGTIDVSGKGYWKAATGSAGVGAGPAAGSGLGPTGAAHGGHGGALACAAALPYDVAEDPDDAGSSGGLAAGSDKVSAGGGVVRFELTGPLTVAGSILASAEDTSKTGTADGVNDETAGAGGAINVEVAELVKSNGVIRADGGSASCPTADGAGRAGGGGRIALRYQMHIQKDNPPNVAFNIEISAEHGGYRWIEGGEEKTLTCVNNDQYGSGADLGTIWMADNKLMGGFGRGLNGQLLNVSDYKNIAGQNYNPFKGGHARLVGSAAMTILGLNVASGARLELGGGEAVNYAGGVRQRCEATPSFAMYWKSNNPISIPEGARLDIYAPKSGDAILGTTGSVITVGGKLCLWSDPETGNAPKIVCKDINVFNSGTISAAYTGKATATGFEGGKVDVWSKTYTTGVYTLVDVSGGNGQISFATGKWYEEGDRVTVSSVPTGKAWAGSTFAGTLQPSNAVLYKNIRPPSKAKGITVILR